MKLFASPQSAAQQYLFFAERQAAKLPPDVAAQNPTPLQVGTTI